MSKEHYFLEVSESHRKTFAQFFTPEIVAKQMAEWILKNHPQTLLDPAFGLGAFHQGVRHFNPNISFTAYEIDPLIFSYAHSITKQDPALFLHNQDYLTSQGTYDAILGNPPYLRFQKFKNRYTILPQLEKEFSLKISGAINTASLFLLKSLTQLKEGGRLAYLMPHEFLNASYGKCLKQYLLEKNLLRHCIFFKNEKEIFPETTTTVCVLLCEKYWKSDFILFSKVHHKTDLESIRSFEDLPQTSIHKKRLDPNEKWFPLFEEATDSLPFPEISTRFSFYGRCTRGIATGANEFFALSKEKIKQHEIPLHQTQPCITKNRQIAWSIFQNKQFEELSKKNREVRCLKVSFPLTESIRQYLREGESKGFHQRFLTRHRKPWYQLEKRKVAPLWIGVFYRERIKIIRNYTSCIHFTCYHSFYPNALGKKFLDPIFLYLLSDWGQEALKRHRRRYGQGLDKFEPNDLNQVMLPTSEFFGSLETAKIKTTMEAIQRHPQEAIKRANDFFHFWAKNLL